MYSTIKTAMLEGIHAKVLKVEVDISNGMPSFDMVGHLLPEVREGKERIRTALHSIGIVLPSKRITVNLSPANLRKSGTGFDLPIAIAIMESLGIVPSDSTKHRVFIGELSLNGDILPVNGVLPMLCDGMKEHIFEFIIPRENICEGTLVKDAKVYAFSHLNEVVDFLNGKPYEKQSINIEETTIRNSKDFSDVYGQAFLKRACEVAAAGMHNMLIIGPPGAGKTMLSERLATILPPLTEEEQLELSKIYSVCGLLKEKTTLITERPFRAPHHTISRVGLTGGGAVPKPGEISLAHNGVLFLDELTEFQKNTIEILRQPLEEHQIHLVRSMNNVTYPSNFLLLAAMNPCNCGYYPDMNRCRCSDGSLRRYFDKVSQPLLDRIDICVEAPMLSYKELTGKEKQKGESSTEIQKRVLECHQIQYERYRNEPFSHNSAIPSARLEEFCPLGEKELKFMEQMYEKMALTARTYHKILRVARTIADLKGDKELRTKHLSEAICYRNVDKKFWGGEV
ncbi:MAG: YifB family Mg chelatase-like AAA ATPase [Agathobacter sp.]|nr:YifB family Mg chelatase-like AAA ATPase [Agathobacter sp.]